MDAIFFFCLDWELLEWEMISIFLIKPRPD